nr:hypothetical protein [Planctomycetota bacterium]
LAQEPGDGPTVGRAVESGREWLLSRQLLDGSWDGWAAKYPGGVTALCAYTLMKSGLPPDHPAVQRALAHLRTQFPTMTYSAGSLLMALEAVYDPENQDWAAEVAEQLADWMKTGGLYGYPGGNADLSNALFAALGFRAAERLGVNVPDKIWRKLVEGALDCSAPDGGFSYGAGGAVGSGSMTSAGITILEFAREAAGRKLGGELSRRMEKATGTGLAWLGEHWNLGQNPPGRLWRFYHFYGLERVGSLLGIEEIGGHAWYQEGAAALLASQTREGTWHEGYFAGTGARVRAEYEELNTCMSILFLRRATARAVTGGGGTPDLLETEGDAAPVGIRVTGRSPVVITVARSEAPGTKARFFTRHSSMAPGESLRLGEVESADGRFAWRQAFERSGRWAVWVELDTPAGTLTSPPLSLLIHDVLDEPFLRYAGDGERNALRGARLLEAKASSQLDDQRGAGLAADGLLGRGWSCAAEDAAPWLELSWAEPVKGRRLLFTSPGNFLAGQGQPRPRALKLVVNGRREFSLELPRDERRKGELDLGRAVSLRHLRVEVLSVWDGQLGRAALGLAEIELQAK